MQSKNVPFSFAMVRYLPRNELFQEQYLPQTAEQETIPHIGLQGMEKYFARTPQQLNRITQAAFLGLECFVITVQMIDRPTILFFPALLSVIFFSVAVEMIPSAPPTLTAKKIGYCLLAIYSLAFMITYEQLSRREHLVCLTDHP